ncbi:hypothetical protein OL548_26060 [Lysinibacillus sp. MHQ-1]|nr:hypothetical protein OL548_26060 [Lysinibacillus sp. MHQ-1]
MLISSLAFGLSMLV